MGLRSGAVPGSAFGAASKVGVPRAARAISPAAAPRLTKGLGSSLLKFVETDPRPGSKCQQTQA